MKVIDFNEEEQEIKRDIERVRQNLRDVEDLSNFDTKPKKDKKNKRGNYPSKNNFLKKNKSGT